MDTYGDGWNYGYWTWTDQGDGTETVGTHADSYPANEWATPVVLCATGCVLGFEGRVGQAVWWPCEHEWRRATCLKNATLTSTTRSEQVWCPTRRQIGVVAKRASLVDGHFVRHGARVGRRCERD